MEIQHKYSISLSAVRPLPPNIIRARVIRVQRWLKMKGGSGIERGIGSDLVNDGDCGGNTGCALHFILSLE